MAEPPAVSEVTSENTQDTHIEQTQLGDLTINLYDLDLKRIKANKKVIDNRQLEYKVNTFRTQRSGFMDDEYQDEESVLTARCGRMAVLSEVKAEELDLELMWRLDPGIVDTERERRAQAAGVTILVNFEQMLVFLELRTFQRTSKNTFILLNNSSILD
mgnify:CR=1 FL=1|jgi:hypothetical protein